MPRNEGMYQKHENRQRNRTFPRPWNFHAREGGFAAVDAQGREMFTVNFTASEMREEFPEGKTRDEALMVMRWLLKLVNQSGQGRAFQNGNSSQQRPQANQYVNRNGGNSREQGYRRSFYPA